MKRVAILVAASPTRAFYSQAAVLRLALQRLHWSRWTPSLHLYVAGPSEPGALEQWQPHLSDVQITRTPDAEFAVTGDWAQSDNVFASAPTDADVYLTLDADTIPVAALEPILEDVLEKQAMAGVVAHYPPFPEPANSTSGWLRDAWQQVAKGLLDRPLSFSYSHTLIGPDVDPELKVAPFYLNFGVVFFPSRVFQRVAARYLTLRPLLMERMAYPDYSGQVALTLAAASEGVRTWALPMRYNFPNDPIAERLHPLELECATVFHYLRTEIFDRHRIFVTDEDYRTFLALPLTGVNRRFQNAAMKILGHEYPFA